MSSARSVFARVIALAQVLATAAIIALLATSVLGARLLLTARLTASDHARERVTTRVSTQERSLSNAVSPLSDDLIFCVQAERSSALTQRVAERARVERQSRLLRAANEYYADVWRQFPERVDFARDTILRGLARWGLCAELVDSTFLSVSSLDGSTQYASIDLQTEPLRQTSACQDAIMLLEEFAQDQAFDESLGDALAFLRSFDQCDELQAIEHDDWVLWDFSEFEGAPTCDPISHAGLVAVCELRQEFGESTLCASSRCAIADASRVFFLLTLLSLPLASLSALLRVCALVKSTLLRIITLLSDVVLCRLRTAFVCVLRARVSLQPLALRDLASVRLLI